MRLHCYECHKVLSTEVPEGTTIRGIIICPECIDKMYEDGRMVDKEEKQDK